MKIEIIVNDSPRAGYVTEHGLALLIHTPKDVILFDTGAGQALVPNAKTANFNLNSVTKLIFSHGHYDHTGGLVEFLNSGANADIYFAPGLNRIRYSRHAGLPVRDISMPESCRNALDTYPNEKKHTISAFTPISEDCFLSGPIPRLSGEDSGGPFYLDESGKTPDAISDEQALLFTDGTLVVGCCHAGIINTVKYCQQSQPDVRIRKIIGGLHLLNATQERISQTRDFLCTLNLEELIPLHCTGVEI